MYKSLLWPPMILFTYHLATKFHNYKCFQLSNTKEKGGALKSLLAKYLMIMAYHKLTKWILQRGNEKHHRC